MEPDFGYTIRYVCFGYDVILSRQCPWRHFTKKAKGSLNSKWIGMKFARNVLHINMHRLTVFDLTS